MSQAWNLERGTEKLHPNFPVQWASQTGPGEVPVARVPQQKGTQL